MPVLSNPRHERFAQELAKGKSATEAMEVAGLSDPRNSTRLTKKDEIRARITELQNRSAERAEITVARLTEDLMRIAVKGEKLGEASGLAVSRGALMDVAKLNGLVIERAENLHIVHDVSDEPISDDEWAAEHATAH